MVMNYAHTELEEVKRTNFNKLNIGELTEDQKIDLTKLLDQYQEIFAWDSSQLGWMNWVWHNINVENATPIKKRWYRTSQVEKDFIAKELQRMLQQGLIEKLKGP